MAPTICGDVVKSKRTLLALGWSIVNLLAFLSFISAIIFALFANNRNNNNNNRNYQYYGGNDEPEQGEEENMITSVTSRAMIFTALWTMVLSTLIGIYGTIVLGFVSPTGNYYWCCMYAVHKTTPMVIGAFIGSLLMYANLTLVCSVLFGEFKVRDYHEGEEAREEDNQDRALSRSSTAFSIMCMFLTILYAGFAALVFTYNSDLIRENEEDERREALRPSDENTMSGFIGSKFNVQSPGTLGVNSKQSRYIQPSSSNDYTL